MNHAKQFLLRSVALTSSLILTYQSAAFAEELSFPSVWKSISEKSPAQKALKEQAEAAAVAKDRADLHWLPHVYVDARQYNTNDPGLAFFGLLEQRSVTQADFNPSTLNYPGTNSFAREALGVDLPLYEGGMKVANVRMQTQLMASAEREQSKIKNEQYAEVAKTYGSMIVLTAQKDKLLEMSKTIERIKKSYKIGDKSNPVGYSGALGLHSISNRLEGLLVQYQAQYEAYSQALREMGLEGSASWQPSRLDPMQFVKTYLVAKIAQSDLGSPAQEAMKAKALAAKEGADMEKARYLPRIGAFAEAYNFSGTRQDDGGYNAGLYLQWNLFDSSDYGKVKEAKLQAASAKHYAAAIGERDKVESQGLMKAAEAMQKNIELIADTEKTMFEQTKVTEGLFHNGSLNALQFLEVLSRRTDLITSQTEVQLAYIKTGADLTQKMAFQIPVEGGSN